MLNSKKNYLAFDVEKDNFIQPLYIYLGGSIVTLNKAETENDAKEFRTTSGESTIDGSVSSSFGRPGTNFIKLQLNETKNRQLFIYESDKLRDIDRNTLNLSFMLFGFKKGYTIEVSAKIEGETIMASMGSVTINEFGQMVILNGIADLNWDKCDNKIVALYFYVGAKGDEARTIWIDDVIYKKR